MRLANVFRVDYGVRKGDRIAIISRNTPHFVVTVIASYILGAIITPINAFLESAALAFCIEDSEPRVVVCDVERWARIRDNAVGGGLAGLSKKIPALQAVVVSPWQGDTYLPRSERDWLASKSDAAATTKTTNKPAVEIADIDDLLDRASSYPALQLGPLSPSDDAMLMYTSGTTGMPKGVLSAQRHMLGCIAIVSMHVARGYLRRSQMPPTPPSPELSTTDEAALPSVLILSPLFHVAGLFGLVNAILRGCLIAFLPAYNARRVIELVRREKLKVVAGVGFMLKEIYEIAQPGDLDSLEGVSHGGAASAPELPGDVQKRTPGVLSTHGFGSTESCGVVLAAVADEYVSRPNTIGHPLPGVDVRIVDAATGMVVPDGEPGELIIRGPCIAKGYWKRPKETAETFLADGFLRTGDLAVQEEDGYVYLLDRIKDIIIRGGENISCASVESAVYSDRRVLECAAVGVPDPRLGERVAIVVVVTHPPQNSSDKNNNQQQLLDPADIPRIAQRAGLAKFAIPEIVWVRSEPLRRNANGKVVKRELRDEVLQWLAKEGRAAKL